MKPKMLKEKNGAKKTASKDKRIGINGLGRIGRIIFRILLKKNILDVVAINDINRDNANIAYQFKYDSLFGNLNDEIASDGTGIIINGRKIFVYHEKNIDSVPWGMHGVERIIESSGAQHNYKKSRNLRGDRIRQIIFTNSPDEKFVDRTVIMGVNEQDIEVKNDFAIAASICDANALAPTMDVLDREYGIEHGFVTTLHPWLSYQNLLDGPSPNFSYPGHGNSHYILGRASTSSILPKPTTVVDATCKVLKHLRGKFHSFSFRVPTAAVSCSDIMVRLNKKISADEIKKLFENEEKKQKFKIFYNNYDPLVSIDFKGFPYSAIIDQRWTTVNHGNCVKLVLWYDNEWGYGCRVIDLASYLFQKDSQK